MKLPDSVFVVILPDDFEHRKNILDWALQNVAKDAEMLFIVHVHEQTSPNELKEKYVSMCGKRNVTCVQLNLDDDVVKVLRKHIELQDITNLVVGVEADELHSEITKSLDYEMQAEAPPCKIWFIACNGPVTLTGHLARSIDDSWIRRILQMSQNKHRFSSLHKLENNTGADAADIGDGFASVVEMVEKIKEEYEGKLHEVTLKRPKRKKELAKEKSPSKVKSPAKSPSRYLKGIEKEKSCQRELQDAEDEKSHLRKQIQKMKTAIEFLNKQIARNEYFRQEPEAAVTNAGGLSEEKNEQQSALTTLPETTVNKVVQEAKENGELDTIVKATAWDWPPELAKQLAHIGLRCVGMMSGLENPAEAPRDDLGEELRQLFDAADRLSDAASQEQAEDHRRPMGCVLMVDPHRYDPESINAGWFTYGNDIPPVTREMIQDKKLIRNLEWMIEHWMVEHQGQVRTMTVCDQNPSQQGHPTIPPAAQSQPPTDPVTTPPDTTSASSSTYSTLLNRLMLTEDDDAGSPTLSLPPPIRTRPRWT